MDLDTAYVIVGLQPTKTRTDLDSSTVFEIIFETNILRISPLTNVNEKLLNLILFNKPS